MKKLVNIVANFKILHIPNTGLPGSPGRINGTLVLVRLAPVPLRPMKNVKQICS